MLFRRITQELSDTETCHLSLCTTSQGNWKQKAKQTPHIVWCSLNVCVWRLIPLCGGSNRRRWTAEQMSRWWRRPQSQKSLAGVLLWRRHVARYASGYMGCYGRCQLWGGNVVILAIWMRLKISGLRQRDLRGQAASPTSNGRINEM